MGLSELSDIELLGAAVVFLKIGRDQEWREMQKLAPDLQVKSQQIIDQYNKLINECNLRLDIGCENCGSDEVEEDSDFCLQCLVSRLEYSNT